MKKLFAVLLAGLLLSLSVTACQKPVATEAKTEAPTTEAPTTEEPTTEEPTTEEPTTEEETEAAADQSGEEEKTVLGEGATVFDFKATDKEGNVKSFEIHTDEKTVGDALLKLELIEGEPGEYGLYVKKVNGILADYDVDQTYWAFYVNGEYAMTGVDATNVEAGATYEFKVEK